MVGHEGDHHHAVANWVKASKKVHQLSAFLVGWWPEQQRQGTYSRQNTIRHRGIEAGETMASSCGKFRHAGAGALKKQELKSTQQLETTTPSWRKRARRAR